MSTADPITTIADALVESPVYVDPRMSSQVPDDVAADLVTTIDQNDLPVYVVVYPVDYGDAYNGRPGQMLALVQEESGLEGTFVHADNDGRVETYAPSGFDDHWEAASVASDETTPAADLERFLDLVISGEGPALQDERWNDVREESSGSGGDGSAWTAVAIVAVIVIVCVMIANAIHRSQTKLHPTATVRRAFDVPASVINAVRKSQESTVATQADKRILELGEALDHTAVPSDGDAVEDYRAALDAYDAAGRVMDGDDRNLADTVGALVLAETGQAHLARATGPARERTREMARPCFFNPLHGAATQLATLKGESRTKVTACAECAKATKSGRQPQALVVTVNGRTVPYYESGLQPWAETGYGALDANLVGHVLTRGIDR